MATLISYRQQLTDKYGTAAFGASLTEEESVKLFAEEEDHFRVSVTYPDGKGSHEITIGELKEKFKAETKEWLNHFISSILTNGIGHTRFGEYKLIKS